MSNDLLFQYAKPIINVHTDTGEAGAEFKLTQFYINNTNENVTVVLRNNLPIYCPKHRHTLTGATTFTVRNVYQFNSYAVVVDTINQITNVINAHGETEDLKLIKDVLVNAYDNDRNCNYARVCIDRKIDILDIKSNGSLYVPEVDVLLQYNHLDVSVPHPFSKNGHAIAEYHKLAEEKKVTGIFIELVDNENNIDKRYMYVANQILEVPVTKDKSKESGVYFTKAINNKFNDIHIKPEFYTFDEAVDYLGLYKSKEEAATGGNPQLVSKVKLAELEEKLQHLKHSNQIDQAEKQALISQLNHELELAKAEVIRTKHEAENNKHRRDDYYDSRQKNRNDYYEDRSYQRKDTHEILKYIPGIALGIVGAFAYVQSKNK
jgi:hypothetical protein